MTPSLHIEHFGLLPTEYQQAMVNQAYKLLVRGGTSRPGAYSSSPQWIVKAPPTQLLDELLDSYQPLPTASPEQF